MPRNRRQQKQERRRLKRKAKRQEIARASQPRGLGAQVREAAGWPVMECWINAAWRDPMVLGQAVVARQDPETRQVAAAAYVIDRACLGVKNALVAPTMTVSEFRTGLLAGVLESDEMVKADLDLVAAVVEAAVDYAAELGFSPHKDYHVAKLLLQGADPDAIGEEIPVGGPQGKPLFIAGPYDNADKIIAKLRRAVGPEGFDYLLPVESADALRYDAAEDDDALDAEADEAPG